MSNIKFTGTPGGIKVVNGSVLIGWIVKTQTEYRFIRSISIEQAINCKLRELNNPNE